MRYPEVQLGRFLSRPNRFCAEVERNGQTILCHVKNTGRLKELLLPGAEVALCPGQNPARKTAWDLVHVRSGDVWVNVDSQATNTLFAEWAEKRGLSPTRREVVHGESRFDFLIGEDHFVEVKGVTLVKDGVALFPDAPTLRGEKHLRHLAAIARSGGKASVVFVAAHPEAKAVSPHPERASFVQALCEAAEAGVKPLGLVCRVTADEAEIVGEIPVILP